AGRPPCRCEHAGGGAPRARGRARSAGGRARHRRPAPSPGRRPPGARDRWPGGGPGVKLSLTVNGPAATGGIAARQSLVAFLRDALQGTGTQVGCEHGVCGACTVRVDGQLVRGCLMLAAQADRSQVETIEGLAERGALTALQRAFRAENALQCGFCTSGMLLTAHELLEREPHPDPAAIRDALGANDCRCTGYHAIVQAVTRAAAGRGDGSKRDGSADAGHIGRAVVRPQTARLVAGRGTYTDDLALPRLAHAAFVRSPHA